MTLKMTTAQVVETSVTVTNSSFQNYTHPDDHATRTTDTPGFKPFTISLYYADAYICFTIELSGGPLAKKYKFEQFHFHWGDKDSEGSEHRLNGNMYPAEVTVSYLQVL